MVPYSKYRMDLLGSKAISEYMRKNDLVILPVGCFEMHGPNIPVACDTFIDWGFSLLLAEEWKCLVFPPVYYTYPGATADWPGTVNISIGATTAYLKEVVNAIYKNGFKKIVLVASHGPNSFMLMSLIRDYFQETGRVVAHFNPYDKLFPDAECKKSLGYSAGEDIIVLAGMRILGLDSSYDPRNKKDLPMSYPKNNYGKLNKMAVALPWLMDKDFQHTGIRSCLKSSDADKAVAIVKKAVKTYRGFPKDFAKYQKEIAAQVRKKPWAKPSIWSR